MSTRNMSNNNSNTNKLDKQLAELDSLLDKFDQQVDLDSAAYANGKIDEEELYARSQMRMIERDNVRTVRADLLAGGQWPGGE